VANTLDLRQPFDRSRASRVHSGNASQPVSGSRIWRTSTICSLPMRPIRRQKHEFMVRVFDAAVLLGTNAVCRICRAQPQQLEMDANLEMLRPEFIPLLKEAKARGLTYRVEQCPMPGWQISDRWHNNIAYAPVRGLPCIGSANATRWEISLHPLRSIACDPDRAGFTFDISIPQGYRLQLSNRWISRQGSSDRCARNLGVGLRRPIHGTRRLVGAAPSSVLADRVNAWKSRRYSASTNCRARRAMIRWPTCRTERWTGLTINWPHASCSVLNRPILTWSLKHEYPKARVQDKLKLATILAGSLSFTRAIDEAAAAMYACSTKCWRHKAYPFRASAGALSS